MDFPATKFDVHRAATRVIKMNIANQIISLKARLKAARGFCMNTSMTIECTLLEAQIKALEKQLNKYTPND
jgi:hypothetical protein